MNGTSGVRKLMLVGLCLGVASVCFGAEWPVLKTYEGEFLRRVKMPLGGIGTGTISLSGRGALVDWEIRNNPAKGFTPTVEHAASGFYIRTQRPDGRIDARLLEGPLDTELYEGGEGSPAFNHGFPRFKAATFKVAYPLAQVVLTDAQMPVSVTLEAMNPLVPGDVETSGIPAALLRWKVTNTTTEPLSVSVAGLVVNPATGEWDGAAVESAGNVGITLGSRDLAACDDTRGRIALMVPADVGEVSRALRIADLGWKVRLDRFWKQFVATGRVADVVDAEATENYPIAALSVALTLAPGETKRVPMALGWHFPHRWAWSGLYKDIRQGSFDPKLDVGNEYVRRFPTAEAAAAALLNGLSASESRTVRFVNEVMSTAAPDVIKEAALFNLSTFRTETCFRTLDGHFFGWEGCFDAAGSCFGSCTHVWGYEHALIDLWPQLAKDMSELQFERAMDARGHLSNRITLPLADGICGDGLAAADGQMQAVLKVYENWRKAGDDAWLRRLYPKVRRAVEFCWIEGGWDADRDGVMEGCQHNTMDVEYYGPNPQMEFIYLAALKAMAVMADAMDDSSFAADCRQLAASGSAKTERMLFNGSYYRHLVMPPKGAIASGLSLGAAGDLSDPDYQLGEGCLVDQLLGDCAARHVGLGPVADEAHAATTLKTILKRNASANVGAVYNCGRDYAFPEEPALKMAWYPEGTMPKKPFPYYGENMTGFEYVVAASLAQRGEFQLAEKVVLDIRSRYDGRKRNPFDESECGHHYVRALASWTVFRSYCKLNFWGQTPGILGTDPK